MIYNSNPNSIELNKTLQPVKVYLDQSTPQGTIQTDEPTATSLNIHSHVRNSTLRRVSLVPIKSDKILKAKSASFIEVGVPPPFAHKHVPIEKSFVADGRKGETKSIGKALSDWVGVERVLGWNSLVRIEYGGTYRYFRMIAAKGETNRVGDNGTPGAFRIHSEWCQCELVESPRYIDKKAKEIYPRIGLAPPFLTPEGKSGQGFMVEELSNLLLGSSPGFLECPELTSEAACIRSLCESASSLGQRFFYVRSLAHYSHLYYNKLSDQLAYDKMTGLKAAIMTGNKCYPCVVGIDVTGCESAEEEMMNSVQGMGGGADNLQMNSIQAQLLAMLGDSQAVSESSNTPHCHIVFVNVGQVKKSGEQLRNACVSDMKFEVPVSDERLESNYKKHSKIPDVLWEDIGGLEHVREEIMDAITLPMMHGDLFKQGGGGRRAGLLLFGPPGTGKTLVAKAVATECKLPFISVKGPELLDSYVGGSEANVRKIFEDARRAARKGNGSSILFFDELDSLAPKRDGAGDAGGGVMDRIVSMLLAELDGVGDDEEEGRVFVIGATNRPDLLDTSLLRPGRFDRMVYLGVAEGDDKRGKVLEALCRKMTFEGGRKLKDVVKEVIGDIPKNLSGADMSAVVSGASNFSMLRKIEEAESEATRKNMSVEELLETWPVERVKCKVMVQDLVEAGKFVTPSITVEQAQRYEELRKIFG